MVVRSDGWTGLSPDRAGRLPTEKVRRLSRVLSVFGISVGVLGGCFSLFALGNMSGAMTGFLTALVNLLLGLSAWRKPADMDREAK